MSIEAHDGLVVACDIDDTLVPTMSRPESDRLAGYGAIAELGAGIVAAQQQLGLPLYFGTVTGRTLDSHMEYEEQVPPFGAVASGMDFKVTGVGSAPYIRFGRGFIPAPGWPPAGQWDRPGILHTLLDRDDLELQEPCAQGAYKASFTVKERADAGHEEYVATIAAALAAVGLSAEVVFSGGTYLDILPKGVNKGTSLLHTVRALALRRPYIIAAGDSMNDCDMLQVADLAIIVANAHRSLKEWAQDALLPHKRYTASMPFSAGIREGINTSGVLSLDGHY